MLHPYPIPSSFLSSCFFFRFATSFISGKFGILTSELLWDNIAKNGIFLRRRKTEKHHSCLAITSADPSLSLSKEFQKHSITYWYIQYSRTYCPDSRARKAVIINTAFEFYYRPRTKSARQS